jgi:hypothetical protein
MLQTTNKYKAVCKLNIVLNEKFEFTQEKNKLLFSGLVEKLKTLHFSNKFTEKKINVPLGHFWARLSNPDSQVEDSHLDDRVVAVDGLVKERQDDWRKSKLKTSKYKSCSPVISLKKICHLFASMSHGDLANLVSFKKSIPISQNLRYKSDLYNSQITFILF